MHILHVGGARPNFMKAASVVQALHRIGQVRTLVHTGQHYGSNRSDVFFQELGLPAPNIHFEVGSSSHTQQTSQILSRFEAVVLDRSRNLAASRRVPCGVAGAGWGPLVLSYTTFSGLS